MNFLLEKQLITFSCTYQPLSFCKILKKFLELIQSYEDVPFLCPKWPICPEQNLLALFIVQNLKNFLLWIQSYEDAPFWAQNGSFAPNEPFFGKIINTILIYLLTPFIVQNLKKILPVDPELLGCPIFGPKMVHFPK